MKILGEWRCENCDNTECRGVGHCSECGVIGCDECMVTSDGEHWYHEDCAEGICKTFDEVFDDADDVEEGDWDEDMAWEDDNVIDP